LGLKNHQKTFKKTNDTCVNVSDTPFAYQFLFNNPFDPEHNSDFAQGIAAFSVATFTFEDAYQYYQNNAQKYAMTGMGVSLNGVPLAAVANDPDVIYDLPLTYGNTGSSNTEMAFDIPTIGYWGIIQNRTYEVDGWGTLLLNNMSFDVIRVRSVINATDSVFTEIFGGGFGFNLPRPEAIEYKWLSPDYSVPVLQINTNAGIVSTVATAPIFETAVQESAMDVQVYPNPATDVLNITASGMQSFVTITDMQGRVVDSFKMTTAKSMDISAWPAGVYCIKMQSAQGEIVKRIAKQ
jgi:hypothetical protein